MSRFTSDKLSILIFIFIFLFYGCATLDTQYNETTTNWKSEKIKEVSNVDHTFYLIGDGGKADLNHIDTHFGKLKNELANASINSTVLYLGDNIYEKGMPENEDSSRLKAEQILDAQISIVKDFKGNPIFIPGNHDYYNDGIIGLKREAEYITKKIGNKHAFLPEDGCPIEKVEISDDIVLIIVDSQWYLEDWDKNTTMNDHCEIKTREGFFEEFESVIKKNENKTILIALHHPMFTNGPHGGQFSFKQQLFPINNSIPLPIVGSFINLLRKTSGASPQDIQNPFYLTFQKRITTIVQKAEKVIFLSGHEHSLQYIEELNIAQIISGSGSKASAAKAVNGGFFSHGGIGYAKVEVMKNGSSWVYYYSESDGDQKLLFQKEIYPKTAEKKKYNFDRSFPKTVKTSIYTKEETEKSRLFQRLWGQHYRKYYGTKVEVPTVLLDTLYGGLTPVRRGGGRQSRSIWLTDLDGREYVMRALRKSATQYFQEVAFKDQYVDEQFKDTYSEELLLDIYTIAHPYASFTNAKLSDAVGLFHTNPRLFYVPKQDGLGHFNVDYGNELYMIEERPSSGHGHLKSFGYSDKIISTNDLLNKLRKSDNHILDESMYIKARLFDMAIGDWDRHQDQWRWAEFEDGENTIYKPVPRDRDQAFSSTDGFILKTTASLIRELRLMQEYKGKMKSVKWFNLEAFPLDITLISEATVDDWVEQAKYLQDHLSKKIIDEAFKEMPIEVIGSTTENIKKIFRSRIANLQDIAKEYYEELHKNAIVKGNDKDNLFEIKRFANGETTIDIFNIKNGNKGSQMFSKKYSNKITKEIWIYGLDDKDVFKVSGDDKNVITLRIIGGQNNDVYDIESGNKVTVYDYKSKENTFITNKGTVHRIDDYVINSHAYKRLKYSKNQIIPMIGANPDDGFRIGLKNSFYKYGFNGNPYTQLFKLDMNYYFATSGFDMKFDAEIGNVIHDWNFHLFSQITSSNYSVNYFGYGNETINDDDNLGVDYNRVKISSITANPSFKWNGRMGASFKFGGLFQTAQVEKTPDRYIGTLPEVSDERQDFLGVNTVYSYQNYDNDALRTMGMKFAVETGWKKNIGVKSENNAYFRPELSFDHKLDGDGKFVLATKLKGNIIIGDNFEFYNAASIGGKDGLRGYRNQRFTGNKSFYQNTDLRYNFQNIKTRLLPLKLGVLAGFDYGRVWYNGENSKDWKTSYGAGFWVVGAKLINMNFYIFNSNEGAYMRLGMGFGF